MKTTYLKKNSVLYYIVFLLSLDFVLNTLVSTFRCAKLLPNFWKFGNAWWIAHYCILASAK